MRSRRRNSLRNPRSRTPLRRTRNNFGLLRKLVLSATSVILTLLFLELCFRIVGIQGDYRTPRIDRAYPIAGKRVEPAPYGFYTNSILVSTYDSNPRGYFDPGNKIVHQHNSVGWRDIEHTIEKPAGVFRILGLGDSYLWGQGVRREDICLTSLPALLSDAIPNYQIETINAGFSGFNTSNERDQLLHKSCAYSPDLVIVHFVLNDVEQDVYRDGPKVEFYEDYTSIYQTRDRISQVSYLWSWTRYRLRKYFTARRYIRECVDSFSTSSPGWRDCRTALLDMKRFCEQNGIRFCVVVFPFFHNLDGDYPFQPIHAAITGFCNAQEIPVLDLRDSYREFAGPELWVHPTDQHPNEIANEIARHEIARFLKDHAAELLSVE